MGHPTLYAESIVLFNYLTVIRLCLRKGCDERIERLTYKFKVTGVC